MKYILFIGIALVACLVALPISAEPLVIGAGYANIIPDDLGFLGYAGMLVNK
ncbi:hypothetical protein [Candidatus Vondammii sp. HM_W22]|uniref:hypothetical protein n=1 Tax=Candidatus Vondammii sp. HM_W22 TaxID=2687299 RepID=UPI001F146BB5|nr:hypothetical protein [Candidatus Vondammii sp. HM_W22]